MTELEVGKKYWVKAKFLGEFTEPPCGPYIPEKRYAFRIGELKTPTCIDFSVEDFECLEASPEREKVTIPKDVADWIEEHKGQFSTVYTAFRILTKREYGIKKWVNENQDNFARAWLNGYTVEQPLGVLLVDMPKGNTYWKYMYLYVDVDGEYDILGTDKIGDNIDNLETVKVTEAEAKEKYPSFKWVSLEELENEVLKND